MPKNLLDRMKNKQQLAAVDRENQSGERQPKSSGDRRPNAPEDQQVAAGTRRPSVFRGEGPRSEQAKASAFRGKDPRREQVAAGTRRPSAFGGNDPSGRGEESPRQSQGQSQNFRQVFQQRGQQQKGSVEGGSGQQGSAEGISTLFRDEVRGVKKGIVKAKGEPKIITRTSPRPFAFRSQESFGVGSNEVEGEPKIITRTSPRPFGSQGSFGVGSNEVGDSQKQQPVRGGKSQGDFRGGPSTPGSVQILDTIKIEETLANRPIIQPQLLVGNPKNPFLE